MAESEGALAPWRALAAAIEKLLDMVRLMPGLGACCHLTHCLDRPFQQREQLPLPSKPPFTAHLGNLSFDVTVPDIEAFFANCEVTSVRLVEDRLDRKPKGFGYVEFRSLDGLKTALALAGTSFQGRNIRISVAEPRKMEHALRFFRATAKHPTAKERQESRELNDWTRKGPLPDLPNQGGRRASERTQPRAFEGAPEPGVGMERGGSRRGLQPSDQGDGKFRDFSNWERKGPPEPVAPAAPPSREGPHPPRGGRSFERRASPASWGEGRSQEGSRPPRPPPVERAPSVAEQDTQWRARMKPDPAPASSPTPTPEASTPSSPSASVAPTPAVRPKLNLQKRTVTETPAAETAPGAASDTKASPFGAARPIDTATREHEIEQKRQAARQKKEEEDRIREEKRQAEKAAAAAAKAEKSSAPPTPSGATPQENGKSPLSPSTASKDASSGGKENGSAQSPTPGRQYEILRRVTDHESGGNQGTMDADVEAGPADGDDVPANGTIVDDKSVKPKEIVRDANAPADAGEQPASTAEGLEGEGWETVSKKQSRGHKSQSSRALAS